MYLERDRLAPLQPAPIEGAVALTRGWDAGDEVRGSAQERGVDATHWGGALRRPLRRHGSDPLEPGGVVTDVLTAEQLVLDARPQQREQERPSGVRPPLGGRVT
jgi:hypothetical protein